jgi:hypothetical protein
MECFFAVAVVERAFRKTVIEVKTLFKWANPDFPLQCLQVV